MILAVLTALVSQGAADNIAGIASIRANCCPLKSVVAGGGFTDMLSLKAKLKDVEIVGMGEPTHGSREVFQMKHRMFEFLVNEMGYSVFGLEASMPDCAAMDKYVTTGEGDPIAAVHEQGFWTWSTEEVLELIKWMRKYNEDPTHKQKLRVVGFDMQNRYGAAAYLRAKFEEAKIESDRLFVYGVAYPRHQMDMEKYAKFFHESQPKIREKFGAEQAEFIKQVESVFRQAYNNEISTEFRQLQAQVAPYLMDTVKKAPELLKKHADLAGDALIGMQVLEKSSKTVYQPTAEEEKNMRAYGVALKEYSEKAKDDKVDLERSATLLNYFGLATENKETNGVQNYRDVCMAKNVEWINKTYMPGQKIMLWAHNGHIGKASPYPNYDWMGMHLEKAYGPKYYAVGFSFNEGSFQAMDSKMTGLKEWTVKPAPKDTLDNNFSQVGKDKFFIDFRGLDPKTQMWLDAPQSTRSIGAVYDPESDKYYWVYLGPRKLFDGMIYIAKTTRAKPLTR